MIKIWNWFKAIGSFVCKIKEKNTSAELSWCRNVSHRCQIVRVPNCLGAEMSHTGAEVSWCRIVPVPKCLVRHRDNSAPVEKDSSAPRHFGTAEKKCQNREHADITAPEPSRPKPTILQRSCNRVTASLRPDDPRNLDFEVCLLHYCTFKIDHVSSMHIHDRWIELTAWKIQDWN